MKGILLIVGMLALAAFPAQAGTHVFVSIGGGGARFQGGCFSTIGGRCSYSPGCYTYRSCGYIGYPGYCYGGYGYYGGYINGYYPVSYSEPSYAAPPPPAASETAPAPSADASSVSAIPPAQAPLLFGILDVNGFIHSPYSDATFKVPNVRNAQMVYDPVTGKPFLVR